MGFSLFIFFAGKAVSIGTFAPQYFRIYFLDTVLLTINLFATDRFPAPMFSSTLMSHAAQPERLELARYKLLVDLAVGKMDIVDNSRLPNFKSKNGSLCHLSWMSVLRVQHNLSVISQDAIRRSFSLSSDFA